MRLSFDEAAIRLITRALASQGAKAPMPAAGKQAAVLVPLCNRHGEASMLFQVRSHSVGTHKGQVSFPGGHRQDGESFEAAALRETWEEMGSGVGPIDVLGYSHTVPAVTGTPVTPVFGWVKEDVGDFERFELSPDEVDTVFTLRLEEMMAPGSKLMEDLGVRGRVPAFLCAGKPKVWGLTG
ncbi:unnamed protein product, partial [Chrysoparadoxa australica]